MAAQRDATDREIMDLVDVLAEVLYEFGVVPHDFSRRTWNQLCSQFVNRAVWIRNCYNCYGACRWLEGELELMGLTRDPPAEPDDDETDSWPDDGEDE